MIMDDKIKKTNESGRLNIKGRVGKIKDEKNICDNNYYGADFDLDELAIFIPKNKLLTQLNNNKIDNACCDKQLFKVLESSITNDIEYNIDLKNNNVYDKCKISPFIENFLNNDNNNSMEEID